MSHHPASTALGLAVCLWLTAGTPAQTKLPPLYSAGYPVSVLDPKSFAAFPLPPWGQGVTFTHDDRMLVAEGDGYYGYLVEYDPDTFEMIRSVTVRAGRERYIVKALAYRFSTREIYATGHRFSYLIRDRVLLRIDRETGFATQIRIMPYFSGGIAFSPDGTLYHLDGSELLTLDPSNGQPTSRLTLSVGDLVSLAVRPTDGALIASSSLGRIVRIDRVTGAVTTLGIGSYLDLEYRRGIRGGCPGTAPVTGPTVVSSPSSAQWGCAFHASSIAAGACVLLLWPPVPNPLPMIAPPGCTGPGGSHCVLASAAAPVAVAPVTASGWSAAIPGGLAAGPILMMQCACVDTSEPATPCAWLSADIVVRVH